MAIMLTLRKINEAVSSTGLELVRGTGYFYVSGENVERLPETIIYAFRINHLSLEQWVCRISEKAEQLNQLMAAMDE